MKAINEEMRKAQVGKYLRPEHFTDGPLSLYLVKVGQEEKESARTGKMYSQNVYEFLDQDREDKIFTGFLDDAFWKAFAKADPEVGQLMKISSEEVVENIYTWTIELGKEIIEVWEKEGGAQEQAEADGGLTEAQRAGKQVLEDRAKTPKEEEITLEDLPEIFQ